MSRVDEQTLADIKIVWECLLEGLNNTVEGKTSRYVFDCESLEGGKISIEMTLRPYVTSE